MYRVAEALLCLAFWVLLFLSVLASVSLSRATGSDLPLLGIPISFLVLSYLVVLSEEKIPSLLLRWVLWRGRKRRRE